MTHGTEQPPSTESLRQGYEPPDVNNRGLLIFFAIFVLTAVVINLGLWGLIKYYVSLPRAVDTITSAAPRPQRFPPPNIQPIEKHNQLPWQDLQDLRNEKNQIFKQLGWNINSDSGVPAIPDDVVSQLAKERSGKGGGR
jgi:hypothetical protein